MQNHRNIYDRVIKASATTPRIKVAILDTGVDVAHPTIQACDDRIKAVKSWLPPDRGTDEGDVSGHGTHVTALLLDIAPDCDVYVAQIADTVPISPYKIAQVRRSMSKASKLN